MKKLLFALLFFVPSCASMNYAIHPGAINSFDSSTYDALLSAQAVIDESRAQFAAKVLPDSLKPALNGLIVAYDVARPAYLAWRYLVGKGQPSDAALLQLNADMVSLTKALTVFKGGK